MSSKTADNSTAVSTSTRKSTRDKLFGRDEMAALLSVDASMPTAASSAHAGGSSRNSKKRGGANGKDEEIDISRLNAYETAEYLSRLKQQKITQHNRKRLRADTSKMEYQKLLEEQQEASTFHITPVHAAVAPQRSCVQEEYINSIVPLHTSREDETSNASVSSSSSSNSDESHYRRRRKEPEIIIRKSEPRKEERSISSSSSSSEESSSSSSESEEEIDARRRRIREKATASTQSTTPSIDKPHRNEEKADEEATTQSTVSPSLSFAKKMFNTSTDTVSTDDDSSSSSTSSSSEDEATSNLGNQCRPLFIPKHQRAITKLDSIQQQQQQEQEEKERQRIRDKRKQESRAMVKQLVLQSKKEDDTLNNYNSISIEEEDLVTGMGVNPPPDDTDTCETKEDELRMYHTWQVRELLRCVFFLERFLFLLYFCRLVTTVYISHPPPPLAHYWKNSSRTR